jgi:protein AATF/BFR2
LDLRNGNDSQDGEIQDDTEDTDVSDDEVQAPQPRRMNGMSSAIDRSELIKAVKDTVTASLVRSAQSDVEQGRAVKKQKAAFDSLLNTRIKLQKSLVGVNTIVGIPAEDLVAQRTEAMDAIEGAELAAFRLWSSLNDMREELIAARTGEKRKLGTFTEATSTEDLWKHTQSQESITLPHRNRTLKRWAEQAKLSTAPSSKGVIDKSKTEPTIIDSIQETLSNRDRLLKRAHTPRSCAPLQLSANISTDPRIYDDADFYGLLLKELLEQKSADSVAAANIDLDFSAKREAKTKKNVDTKASKGRKLKYTVHEKLQNFMAPEDRGNWSQRQADELFGGLFGRRLELHPRDEDEEMEMSEEEGLILFRS